MTKNRMSAFEMTLVSEHNHSHYVKLLKDYMQRKAGYSKNRTKYYLKKMLWGENMGTLAYNGKSLTANIKSMKFKKLKIKKIKY